MGANYFDNLIDNSLDKKERNQTFAKFVFLSVSEAKWIRHVVLFVLDWLVSLSLVQTEISKFSNTFIYN